METLGINQSTDLGHYGCYLELKRHCKAFISLVRSFHSGPGFIGVLFEGVLKGLGNIGALIIRIGFWNP